MNILLFYDEERNNGNLLSNNIQYAIEDYVMISDQVRKLTFPNISKAMHLISHACEKFSESETDENHNAGVARFMNQAISCYKEKYLQKIAKNSTNFRQFWQQNCGGERVENKIKYLRSSSK